MHIIYQNLNINYFINYFIHFHIMYQIYQIFLNHFIFIIEVTYNFIIFI